MKKQKEKTKIYVRNFIYDDGHVETVETKDGEEITGHKYRGEYGRALYGRKLIETKDEVRFE